MRRLVYGQALKHYGIRSQCIVAMEEFSEAQKEICKRLRGEKNDAHLAEELADAQIMIEQMIMAFGLEEEVERQMEYKIRRLEGRMRDEIS